MLELWPPVRSDVSGAGCISESTALQSLLSAYAGVAQLVERHVANVQVDGSNPFTRSNSQFLIFNLIALQNQNGVFMKLVNLPLFGGYYPTLMAIVWGESI